jgi:hypothetical protein
MSADRHLHDPPRPRTEVDVAGAAILAILDARIVLFTSGDDGCLSMATGVPLAAIKKAWELKDSGHGVVCPIRRPIAEEPTMEAIARTASRRWLEAKERDRCANLASKAVAAGLGERTVRIAERQGQLMVEMGQAALREVDLSPEQASAFKAALARQARELTAPSCTRRYRLMRPCHSALRT